MADKDNLDINSILSILGKYPGASYQSKGYDLQLSPLGFPEVTVPGNMIRGNAVLGGSTYPTHESMWMDAQSYRIPQILLDTINKMPNNPTVLYSANPDDTTKNHERIHVGQHVSGYQETNQSGEPIDIKMYMSLLENAKSLGLLPTFQGSQSAQSPVEVPAYSFSNPQKYNPSDFANYINRVHLTSPFPEGLEASMPDQEMKQYLKTTPVPYNKKPPKINMQEDKGK